MDKEDIGENICPEDLIEGILEQALKDVVGKGVATAFERMDAYDWITSRSYWFRVYCDLLGIDPEDLAARIERDYSAQYEAIRPQLDDVIAHRIAVAARRVKKPCADA